MPDTTCHMSISLDGFVAGPDQGRENPLGLRGIELHRWHIGDPRATETDAIAAEWLMRPRGAYVMGRNMFGPIRGPWDEDWRGWWGAEPPYHAPVFVLTHHAHDPIEMEGGTTFHFVTDGIEAALTRARQAAAGRDVRLGGGVATIREYLRAGLVDEMHLAISPVVLGRGEALLEGIDLAALGYRRSEHASSPAALHLVLSKGG